MTEVITNNLDLWTSVIITKSTAGRGRNGQQEAYGIKKLRELILELAVRGKLVPQDPNDEPASELLHRVAVEKAKMVRDKQITRERDFLAIADDEIPFDLPNRWEWARINDVGHDWGQKTPDAEFTYIDVSVIDNSLGVIDEPSVLSQSDAPSRARKIVRKGTVIYSTVRPYLKNICVIEEDYSPEPIASTAFAILHPFQGMPAKFFALYLRSPEFVKYVEAVQTGIAYPAINDKQFYGGLVPIPPLPEQHRIVSKVEELMALCDQLEQQQTENLEAHQTLVETLLGTLTRVASQQELSNAWTRIATHFDTLFTTEDSIAQLKQTILQLAVMGKLVPQDPYDEHASILLDRIAKKKKRMVQEGTIKAEKPLPAIGADEKPFAQPEGWKWVRLGEVVHIRGGKRVSNGYQLLSSQTPHIYIRVSDMKDGSIDDSDLRYIEATMYSKIRQYIITKDDIYMTIVGATIGKCGIVPTKFDGMNLTENAARLTPVFVSKYYLYKVLSSAFCQEQFIDKTKQVGVQKMALNRLASTIIPLAPLAEQHRIITKVDELMALCEALKARLKKAQTTQIYLADAIVEQAVA